mmetsp:Transcript_72047/g.199881  ORF Transcript_72047/g.199881 Transcript_72047/m.199881 type:complete len:408 (-) Transcript_72047:153-1376(-)
MSGCGGRRTLIRRTAGGGKRATSRGCALTTAAALLGRLARVARGLFRGAEGPNLRHTYAFYGATVFVGRLCRGHGALRRSRKRRCGGRGHDLGRRWRVDRQRRRASFLHRHARRSRGLPGILGDGIPLEFQRMPKLLLQREGATAAHTDASAERIALPSAGDDAIVGHRCKLDTGRSRHSRRKRPRGGWGWRNTSRRVGAHFVCDALLQQGGLARAPIPAIPATAPHECRPSGRFRQSLARLGHVCLVRNIHVRKGSALDCNVATNVVRLRDLRTSEIHLRLVEPPAKHVAQPLEPEHLLALRFARLRGRLNRNEIGPLRWFRVSPPPFHRVIEVGVEVSVEVSIILAELRLRIPRPVVGPLRLVAFVPVAMVRRPVEDDIPKQLVRTRPLPRALFTGIIIVNIAGR